MKSLKLLFFSFIMLCTLSTYAQSVDALLDQYYENIGGRDAWSNVKSVVYTGIAENGGMNIPIKLHQKVGKQKISFEFQGQTLVQSCFDGQDGWATNFMNMKAEKMEAEDSAILKNELEDFPDAFLNYKEKGYTISLEGSESIDGVDCHKVKIVKKPLIINGEEVENASYYFFDKDASVPIAYKSVVHKGPGKGQTITTLLSDYQEVDGLFAPFSMVMKVEENIMSVIKMEEAKFNVAIEDTIFTFPSGQ